jgi:hypothetical protein
LFEFESAREWADLSIALKKVRVSSSLRAINRLFRSLQVSITLETKKFFMFQFIPQSCMITLTKRLAQCLHRGGQCSVAARSAVL